MKRVFQIGKSISDLSLPYWHRQQRRMILSGIVRLFLCVCGVGLPGDERTTTCPRGNGTKSTLREMVAYAASDMPKADGKQKLVLFEGQKAVMDAAERAGYTRCGGYNERVFDFEKSLEYPLPEGFRFVEPGRLEPDKIDECCWKGFDHEREEGPWNGDGESVRRIMAAPHATPFFPVAVENDRQEYVCFAGMWWTPENRLAYMEPLCTVPEYRGRGLASAALSELFRRMKPLGASHMTGGGDPFYEKIGFEPCIGWTFWEKEF